MRSEKREQLEGTSHLLHFLSPERQEVSTGRQAKAAAEDLLSFRPEEPVWATGAPAQRKKSQETFREGSPEFCMSAPPCLCVLDSPLSHTCVGGADKTQSDTDKGTAPRFDLPPQALRGVNPT